MMLPRFLLKERLNDQSLSILSFDNLQLSAPSETVPAAESGLIQGHTLRGRKGWPTQNN